MIDCRVVKYSHSGCTTALIKSGLSVLRIYVPYRKTRKAAGVKKVLHSNRIVIHPDYVGLGLGMKFVDATSQMMFDKGYEIMVKFSALPMFFARVNNPRWQFLGRKRQHKVVRGGNMVRDAGFRMDVTTYQFRFNGETGN